MDKVCAICYDEMDMNSYEDENDSTSTCFKLECGHAYHTRCIVSCLQRTHSKCPQCNSHKTPQQVLTMEGLITEVFDDVRKKQDLKPELIKYKESKKELETAIKTIKDDVKDFIEKRKHELQFKEKKKQLGMSMRAVRLKFGKICKQRGPLYSGAYSNTADWRRTRLIFPGSHHIHRRRYPYVFVRL